MQNMIDMMNISECVVTDFPPVAPVNERDDEIASLWTAHQNAKNTARMTNEELRAIRVKLGAQLSQMKGSLARAGRDGQWSGFLREHKIPRASADRLVARHEKTIDPNANCVSESISEPTEDEVAILFRSILPRLRRTMRTPESVYAFIAMLTDHFECGESTDRGILVLKPDSATICPASLDGNVDEPEMGASVVARTDS